jgi:hypothetical protein
MLIPGEGKLKQLPSLRWRLFSWILVGFLLFVVAPLAIVQSSCPQSEKSIWTVKGKKQSGEDQKGSDDFGSSLIIEQQNPNEKNGNASKHDFRDYLPSWLCGETKVTDVLLAFLTYCLVIIGWFGIRSSERTTRELERAYIFATPQIDASKKRKERTTYVEIMLQNYGRTMGTVEIVYGEVSQTVEPYGIPLYRKGSARVANGAIEPTLGKPIRAPVTFECPTDEDFYFFGYVTYTDLFRRPHTSRFCAKIFVDGKGIEAAGTPDFHDWN